MGMVRTATMARTIAVIPDDLGMGSYKKMLNQYDITNGGWISIEAYHRRGDSDSYGSPC